jgi:hypothetical protein
MRLSLGQKGRMVRATSIEFLDLQRLPFQVILTIFPVWPNDNQISLTENSLGMWMLQGVDCHSGSNNDQSVIFVVFMPIERLCKQFSFCYLFSLISN